MKATLLASIAAGLTAGQPLKLYPSDEPWTCLPPAYDMPPGPDPERIAAAQLKRQRKNAKRLADNCTKKQ